MRGPLIVRSTFLILARISPFLLAVKVARAPVGGLRFLGLKISPTFLHWFLTLPLSWIAMPYRLKGLNPLKLILTLISLSFLPSWINAILPLTLSFSGLRLISSPSLYCNSTSSSSKTSYYTVDSSTFSLLSMLTSSNPEKSLKRHTALILPRLRTSKSC